MKRISKVNYYLNIAQTVAERSTCLRRNFGAIIVKDDVIVSTGYNGAPRGRVNCSERGESGECLREQLKIPRGERYELCRAVHAEANAIIAASREEMKGAVLYMTCVNPADGGVYAGTCSCAMCKRLIINAGIEKVVVRENAEEYREYLVSDWVAEDDVDGAGGY